MVKYFQLDLFLFFYVCGIVFDLYSVHVSTFKTSFREGVYLVIFDDN